MSSSLTLGAVHTAELVGIAGAWTVYGTATVWEVGPDGAVLLQVSDSPSPHRISHTVYCRGRVRVLPDGSREVVDLVVPQPGPTRIGLGWRVLHRRDPAEGEHHVEQAVSALTSWEPVPAGDGPLGESALPWLARSAAAARAGVQAAADRDRLVRRLRLGQVPREQVAEADGRSPQRITQLCTV
ncbi:hypothetical protein [Kitasatospora purpeofusca]|uniref:hypothetical protein n=1 Tax=Kitasatospora purpeofusca TaxID=67352 RepID=UPI0036522EE3